MFNGYNSFRHGLFAKFVILIWLSLTIHLFQRLLSWIHYLLNVNVRYGRFSQDSVNLSPFLRVFHRIFNITCLKNGAFFEFISIFHPGLGRNDNSRLSFTLILAIKYNFRFKFFLEFFLKLLTVLLLCDEELAELYELLWLFREISLEVKRVTLNFVCFFAERCFTIT